MKVDIKKLRTMRKNPSLHAVVHSSSLLTSIFIRLNISANQVTFLSCVTGSIGAFVLYTGPRMLLIPLFYLYTVLDYSDGWVARYTGTESEWGNYIDHINHTIVTVALLAVASVLTGQYLFGVLAFSLYLCAIKLAYDVRILGGTYGVIQRIGAQLPLELVVYLAVVLNRLELVILAHLVLYGTTFILSMVTKIKGDEKDNG